jgi:hypothetical protein
VGCTSGRQKVKEMKAREYGGWTSYTYVENKETLTIALSGVGRGLRGRDSGGNLMYNIRLIRIVTMNPPIMNIF